MKKRVNDYKNYNSLSKQEAALLNGVEPQLILSPSTIRRLLGWKQSAVRNTLSSLKKKGVLVSIQRNSYVLAKAIPENLFAIATATTNPSYISFWTACSYYGFTEQQVRTVQVVSPKQFPTIKFDHHTIEVTTFQPKKWFGYCQLGTASIAEPEKAIIDCLYKPEKAGGISELRSCLKNAWPSLNQKKLKAYLRQFSTKSVMARLGYFLDELHLPCQFKSYLLRQLPKGYTRLNPSKKPTNLYNHQWRIIVND